MPRKPGDRVELPGRGVGATMGDLLARQGVVVSRAPATPPAPAARPVAAAPGVNVASASKVVVRREKKGRGGKTVTVVAGLGIRRAELERVARDLRRALGCGSMVEGDDIVVQGDLMDRLEAWLRQRGARTVVRGN